MIRIKAFRVGVRAGSWIDGKYFITIWLSMVILGVGWQIFGSFLRVVVVGVAIFDDSVPAHFMFILFRNVMML